MTKLKRNRYGVPDAGVPGAGALGAFAGNLVRGGGIPRSIRRGSLALTLLAFCVCLSLAACATADEPLLADIEQGDFTPIIDDIEMLKVGAKAPLFEVSDVFGNRLNFGDKVGKHVIALVFWSVYCDPCRASMPAYNEIYRRHRDKGLEFYTINMDGEEMTMAIRGFLADENIELPVLLDELEGEFLKIADPYGVQGTPTIYIIDKKGRIAFGKVGTIPIDTLSALITAELAK